MNKAELLRRAAEMRRNPTEWEKRFWRHVSNSQLGFKLRRQAVIPPFICDFFCPGKGVVVEIDGDTHDPADDERRDRYLTALGLQVLRFSNLDVRDNVEGVLTIVLDALHQRPDRWLAMPHPNPSPEGEGLKE